MDGAPSAYQTEQPVVEPIKLNQALGPKQMWPGTDKPPTPRPTEGCSAASRRSQHGKGRAPFPVSWAASSWHAWPRQRAQTKSAHPVAHRAGWAHPAPTVLPAHSEDHSRKSSMSLRRVCAEKLTNTDMLMEIMLYLPCAHV